LGHPVNRVPHLVIGPHMPGQTPSLETLTHQSFREWSAVPNDRADMTRNVYGVGIDYRPTTYLFRQLLQPKNIDRRTYARCSIIATPGSWSIYTVGHKKRATIFLPI